VALWAISLCAPRWRFAVRHWAGRGALRAPADRAGLGFHAADPELGTVACPDSRCAARVTLHVLKTLTLRYALSL
jgi:hypothetical protein